MVNGAKKKPQATHKNEAEHSPTAARRSGKLHLFLLKNGLARV